MTHPSTDPRPLGVIARHLHERIRESLQECPAWEDLDMTDLWDGALIRIAYERAREFVAMSGGDEE